MSSSALVFDVGADNFDLQVVQASHDRPVMVDFWAEWCGPCRNLAPILDQVIQRYDGKVLLAKIDTDRHQELAAQNGIRSLPTVRLYRNGKAVDERLGLQPESSFIEMIENHLPRESDPLIAQARAQMDAGDADLALATLRGALELEPDYAPTLLTLAQALIAAKQPEQALDTLRKLPANLINDETASRLRAQAELAQAAEHLPATAELEAILAKDNGDLDTRFQLALSYVEARNYEPAMEHLLEIIRTKKDYAEGSARKRLLEIFEILGPREPSVVRCRSALAAAIM